MVRPDGYVKVLDFGLAKLSAENLTAAVTVNEVLSPLTTSFGSRLGTVRYMSPEQPRGAPVSKTTDIWSLGAFLYEMVTGQAAFNGDATAEVIAAILETEPPPLTSHIAQAVTELQQIVSKALSKDQSQRYRSAQELLKALKSFHREIEVAAELRRRANPRRLGDAHLR
jgi:serine/threonine protein kinase